MGKKSEQLQNKMFRKHNIPIFVAAGEKLRFSAIYLQNLQSHWGKVPSLYFHYLMSFQKDRLYF